MIISTRRRIAVTVFGVLVTLLAVFGVGSVSAHPAAAATLGSSPTATVTADDSVPNEDEAPFNPCAMGNLGPCDLSTTLPYGGWLTLNVAELFDPQGISCDGAQVPVRVTVAAVAGDGATVRAHVAVLVCASRVAPPIAPEISALLPGLYRVVAAQV